MDFFDYQKATAKGLDHCGNDHASSHFLSLWNTHKKYHNRYLGGNDSDSWQHHTHEPI